MAMIGGVSKLCFSLALFFHLALFHDLPTIRTHIEMTISPAFDSGDVQRWMDNIDLAATAKMFRINIPVCERVQQNIYRWQLYTPELHSSVNKCFNRKT